MSSTQLARPGSNLEPPKVTHEYAEPDEVKGEASDSRDVFVRGVVADNETLPDEEVSRKRARITKGNDEIHINDEYNMDGIDEDLWQHIEAQLRSTKSVTHCGRTVLHRAAARGLSELVGRLLVACPFLIDEQCQDGTALHLAAGNGHAAVVAQLLTACPLMNAWDMGDTALHLAARNGHAEIVTQLLAVDPTLAEARTRFGETALFCAAREGHVATMAQLLAANPTLIDARNDEDCTALHVAAGGGHAAMVAHLLAVKPALAEARTDQDHTALHFAASGGHAAIVTQLLAVNPALADAKTDDGWTALHAAAASGHAATVTELLAANPALINAKSDGCTALYSAALSGHAAITAQLLAAKASTEASTDYGGRTVLHAAVDKGCNEIVSQLLAANPALIDAKATNGSTVLHCARRDDIIAQLLAARPALLDAMINDDVDSGTALLNAVKLGQEETAIRLLTMYPNLICEASNGSCGWTVFHFAACFAREKVMSWLLTAVSEPDLEKVLRRRSTQWHFDVNEGMTALHVAAMRGHRNMVAQLLAACPSLIDVLDYHPGFCPSTVNILLEFKPALAHAAVDAYGNTLLHLVVCRRDRQHNIELIGRVWKTNPDALRAVNCDGLTPFHLAVAYDNDNAIEVLQGSLTFAEIAKVFSHYEKSIERLKPLMQLQCEELAVELLPGVVDIVFEYLGFRTVKQKLRQVTKDTDDG